MKKILLATAFIFTTAISSFGKDVDTKLLKDLTAALKSSPDVQWSEIDHYVKAAFSFNGKEAYAFYTPDKVELVGFCILVDKEDLNPLFLNAINKKYPDEAVVEAIMVIDAKAYSEYFYHIKKENKDFAVKVKISKNGKPNIYGRIKF